MTKPEPQSRCDNRLLPDVPLPPYTYVPGRTPHPVRDPGGHSYGIEPAASVPLTEENWRTHRVYLRGLDLFNAGYYWESHVEFESVWIACGRRGPTADFFKALIKLAAAGVKARADVPAGVVSHAGRAAVLLLLHGAQRQGGLRLAELAALAETIHAHGWPRPDPILRPET